MRITIFTPTYNRAYIIENLYRSLQRQTCKDFEWVVVDDGSSDNTEQLFDEWKKEDSFSVKYIQQINGGKHRAINKGVCEARGELFFIVDSDDYLVDDAIEIIIQQYESVKNDNMFAGVCGLRCYPDGSKIGGGSHYGVLDCNSLDFRYKYKIKGDMAEVIKTKVMREYPFPEYKGEKFCPEAVLFNRIAQKYKLRYFYEKIYVCDYLSDGLSAKITKIRMQSPIGTMVCYSELSQKRIPFHQKMKAIINYWRFRFCTNNGIKKVHFIDFLLLPIGLFMHIKDKYTV